MSCALMCMYVIYPCLLTCTSFDLMRKRKLDIHVHVFYIFKYMTLQEGGIYYTESVVLKLKIFMDFVARLELGHEKFLLQNF